MITSATPFFNFFLKTRLSVKLFLIGSTMAIYGLYLYEALPEYLFNPAYLILYYVIPISASFMVVVIVPGILNKKIFSHGVNSVGNNAVPINEYPETFKYESPSTDEQLAESINFGKIPEMVTESVSGIPIEVKPLMDESLIEIMIDKKTEKLGNETSQIKTDVKTLHDGITALRINMEEMSHAFENNMIDLKSLVNESNNPFTSVLKNPNSHQLVSQFDTSSDNYSPYQLENMTKNSTVNTLQENNAGHESSKNILAFRKMLDGNLPLGKLMAAISLIGELLETLGHDSIKMLLEQCKLMGLQPEDEHLVYNIVNMLNKSGVSVTDNIIIMYKFAQIMGITDKDADLLYNKIISNNVQNRNAIRNGKETKDNWH